MQNETDQLDVTIIGGGLAGLAASIHLTDAGLKVLCIEANPHEKDPVGESLDWSAPDLLKALGLPMEYLPNPLHICRSRAVGVESGSLD